MPIPITTFQHINVTGVKPRLACILVGDNPASQVYVGHKQRACKEVGIASELIRFPTDVSNHTVENCLEGMARIKLILSTIRNCLQTRVPNRH